MKKILALAAALTFVSAIFAAPTATPQLASQPKHPVSSRGDLTPQTLPEGLQTEKWAMAYLFGARFVDAAIDGETLWVGHFLTEEDGLPEAAFKGKIEGDKVVFDSKQFLGTLDITGVGVYDFYFMPVWSNTGDIYADVTELRPQLVMNFDKGAKRLTCQEPNWGFCVNGSLEEVLYLHIYQNVSIFFQDTFKPAMPKNPSDLIYGDCPEQFWEVYGMSDLFVYLPLLATDNSLLDRENYYYSIYLDDDTEPYVFDPEDFPGLEAETTQIPFNFQDMSKFFYTTSNFHIIYFPFSGCERIGVQGIYKIDGTENRTPIIYTDGSAVSEIAATPNQEKIYYNLMGVRVDRPSHGIYICQSGDKVSKIVK